MAEKLKIHSDRVRQIMIARGYLEQKELAQASGVSEGTLVRMFAGKPFTSTTLRALANTLDVNPIDLLDTSGFPAPLVGAPVSAVGCER